MSNPCGSKEVRVEIWYASPFSFIYLFHLMRLSHWREAWAQNTLRTIASRVQDKATNTKSKDIDKIHSRGMTRVKTTTRVTKDIRQQNFERGMRDSSLSAVCISFHFKRCTQPEASSGTQWWVGNWVVLGWFLMNQRPEIQQRPVIHRIELFQCWYTTSS